MKKEDIRSTTIDAARAKFADGLALLAQIDRAAAALSQRQSEIETRLKEIRAELPGKMAAVLLEEIDPREVDELKAELASEEAALKLDIPAALEGLAKRRAREHGALRHLDVSIISKVERFLEYLAARDDRSVSCARDLLAVLGLTEGEMDAYRRRIAG